MSDINTRSKLSLAQVFFICLVACLLTYVTARYRFANTHSQAAVETTATEAVPQAASVAEKASEKESAANYRFVTRVIEPNLLQLEDGSRVALLGIELPGEPDPTSDRFAREALAFSKGLMEGRKVRLEYESADSANNSNQHLAYVYLQDGTLVNAEVLKKGYAACSTDRAHLLSQDFRNYEREAHHRENGIWSYSEPPESAAENITDDLFNKEPPVTARAVPKPTVTSGIDPSPPPPLSPALSQTGSYSSSSEDADSAQTSPGYAPSRPSYKPPVAENGSYFGEISERTGRPKTVHVEGYTRSDGTYVREHYRSAPRRH